jgi:hypothetical protein
MQCCVCKEVDGTARGPGRPCSSQKRHIRAARVHRPPGQAVPYPAERELFTRSSARWDGDLKDAQRHIKRCRACVGFPDVYVESVRRYLAQGKAKRQGNDRGTVSPLSRGKPYLTPKHSAGRWVGKYDDYRTQNRQKNPFSRQLFLERRSARCPEAMANEIRSALACLRYGEPCSI